MRAFDVLTKAENDIRGSTQPRYHLELALLRWIHLRKLVPLGRHHQGTGEGRRAAPRRRPRAAACRGCAAAASEAQPVVSTPRRCAPSRPGAPTRRAKAEPAPRRARWSSAENRRAAAVRGAGTCCAQRRAARRGAEDEEVLLRHRYRAGAADRDRWRSHGLAFAPRHGALKLQLEQSRAVARRAGLAPRRPQDHGRGVEGAGPAPASALASRPRRRVSRGRRRDKQTALKQKAMADSGVQAMLDVFRTDIKEVEEM